MQLVKNSNGDIGLISKYVPNLKPVNAPNHALNEGFGADVLLANWDAVISNNAQTNGQKLFRIDFGGTLNYRAQGEIKDFGIVADELTTMLNPDINYESAYLFSTMTRDELIASLEKVVSLDNDALKKLVDEFCGENSRYIFNTLTKRKEFLSYVLETIKKTPKENKTMLEYLENIKETVLKTPLTEFETYKAKHPKSENSNLLQKFGQKIKSNVPSNKNNQTFIKDKMLSDRNNMEPVSGKPVERILDNIKDSYSFVNEQIRHNDLSHYNNIDELDNIISQLSIPKNTVLYRGGSPYDFSDMGHCIHMSSKEFLDTFYKKGECFTIPIFPNTSLDKNIGEHFAQGGDRILYKINAPKGTPGVYMENIPGSMICEKTNEEEILLARNLIYKFKNRTSYFGYELVELDIIPNVPKNVKVHNYEQEMQKIAEQGDWNKYFSGKTPDKSK